MALLRPGADSGEIDHICCCDPGIALCGAPVTGTAVSFEMPDAAHNPCSVCFDLDRAGVKCRELDCPGPLVDGAV